jgi:G3E family GTPase
MKLIILAGFLGSGKTTLLLKMARKYVEGSLQTAIIENEIGEVGIDGNYLSQEGVEVQELFGGCICCTLSVGLVETIDKISKLYNPDVIIIEATGIARPADIIPIIRQYGKNIDKIKVITIVDSVRYDAVRSVMGPLVEDQARSADTLVINKIDEVEGDAVEMIINDLKKMNHSAQIFAVSLEKQTGVSELMDNLP